MMSSDALRQQVLDLAAAIDQFKDWDAESDQPKMVEVEFDAVWKLVVVWEDGFRTVKVHQRLREG